MTQVHRFSPFVLLAISGASLTLAQTSALAEPSSADPHLQEQSQFADQSIGDEELLYYPTGAEYDYSEQGMHEALRLDASAQMPTDGHQWQTGVPQGYDQGFYRYTNPLNPAFEALSPGQTIGFTGSDPLNSGHFSMNLHPMWSFNNNYHPRGVVLKAGPLYLDIASVSGTMLYASYDTTARGQSSYGWIGMLDANTRVLLQLTDDFFLVGHFTPYLTTQGDLGIALYPGGSANFLELRYRQEVGDWEILAYDLAYVSSLWSGLYNDTYDSVGRYRFGRRPSHRDNAFFEGDDASLINIVGVTAERKLSTDWALRLGGHRSDSWRLSDGSDHYGGFKFSTEVFYVGKEWAWQPFVEYGFFTGSEFDQFTHVAYTGVRRDFSPGTWLTARVGYGHQDSDNGNQNAFLASLRLNQRLGPYTSHRFSIGHDYLDNFFDNPYMRAYSDPELRKYVDYRIIQRLGASTILHAMTSINRIEHNSWQSHHSRFDYWDVGMVISQKLGSNLTFDGGYIYRNLDSPDNDDFRKSHTWSGAATYMINRDWQFMTRYQYQESVASSDINTFDEHVLSFRLTRFF